MGPFISYGSSPDAETYLGSKALLAKSLLYSSPARGQHLLSRSLALLISPIRVLSVSAMYSGSRMVSAGECVEIWSDCRSTQQDHGVVKLAAQLETSTYTTHKRTRSPRLHDSHQRMKSKVTTSAPQKNNGRHVTTSA